MNKKDWQVKTKDGKVYGPVETETLKRWIQEKRILSEDLVWDEDKKEWMTIESMPEFYDSFKIRGKAVIEPPKSQEIKTPEEQSKIIEVKTEKSVAEDTSQIFSDDKSNLTFQLIADAWRAMLGKGIWSIIGALVLMGLVSGVGDIASSFIPIGGMLIQLLVSAALALGWAGYSLRIARREEMGMGTIFAGFKGNYIWQALGAMLLMSFLPGLAGLISFGIWGFYLSLAYIMSYFFIFDENKGPWEGMKASFDATKGYKWRIIAVQVVCAVMGMLLLGIGLIVTMPLANIAIASLYYRIRTDRISAQHLQTSVIEYFIVLIPFIIMIAVFGLVFFRIIMKQMPLLLPQIEQTLKNLPRQI